MFQYKKITNEFIKHLFQHRKESRNIKINILHFMFGTNIPFWAKSDPYDLDSFLECIVRPKTIAYKPRRYRRSRRRYY